jgi:putative membrane protein
MTTRDILLSMWDFEPSVVIGCAALATGYLTVTRARPSIRTVWFLSGVLLLFLDLVSPLDALADTYLFSAHVAQHFVLALIVPILLLLGAPRSLAEITLAQPTVSWLLGVGTMIVWHIPAFFNAALQNESLHIFQHLTFLVTGTIFWRPILAPSEDRRLAPLSALVYLFSACTACSLLGALLTFSPPGAYPAYLNPADRLGILPLIRNGWGLDPESDQQLGGMLMWVPGCLVYLSAILATFARWHRLPEREATQQL